MAGLKAKKLIIIGTAAIIFAACLFVGLYFIKSRSGAVILMYHNVVKDGGEESSVTVSESKLRSDFEYIAGLKEKGYKVVLPRDIAAGEKLTNKTIVITFDDGYKSNYEIAYPLLKEYGLCAEINVITDLIDQSDKYKNFCSWQQLKEMSDSGIVEIGSHSHNLHNPDNGGNIYTDRANGVQSLSGETEAEFKLRVEADILTSIERIEQKTGIKPTCFAYPYGASDGRSSGVVNSNFQISLSTNPGKVKQGSSLYNLCRYSVGPDTDIAKIIKK